MVIKSASNDQIKKIIQLKEKAKVRRAEGCFIVEGIKMFNETPKEDIVKVYASENFVNESKNKLAGMDYQVISDDVFKKISDTVTPQGVMVIVKQKKYDIEDIIKAKVYDKELYVILDKIQDPGNLGTIVRTAEGAGVKAIIMSNTTVDIYNPKVIRSTMGSIYRVPFVISNNLPETVDKIKEAGVICYAAHLKGGEYSKEVFPAKTAIMIGNEANGLSDEVAAKADSLIKIPMKGKVESLNAGVAAAILMYQVGV